MISGDNGPERIECTRRMGVAQDVTMGFSRLGKAISATTSIRNVAADRLKWGVSWSDAPGSHYVDTTIAGPVKGRLENDYRGLAGLPATTDSTTGSLRLDARETSTARIEISS